MKDLILIGYWRSIMYPEFPDPAWFVDETWDRDVQLAVVQHLRNGTKLPIDYMGASWCRFRCGEVRMGSSEYTDGEFAWPSGLIHYLEHHLVRLPDECTERMLKNHSNPGRFIEGSYQLNSTWWLQQTGFKQHTSSYNFYLDIGLLRLSPGTSMGPEVLRLVEGYLNSFPPGKEHQSAEKLLQGETIWVEGRFKDVEVFARKAESMGLTVTFRYARSLGEDQKLLYD